MEHIVLPNFIGLICIKVIISTHTKQVFYGFHDYFDIFFYRFDGALLEEGALSVAVQGENLTPDFMALCVLLSEHLKSLCSIQEHVTGNKLQNNF